MKALILVDYENEWTNKNSDYYVGDISEVIKTHTGRGTSLISNVRKLSELEEFEIILKPIGVFDVLNKSVENAKRSFYHKKINVKTEGLSKDTKILGDELLIDVFDNILNNAVKFSDDEDKEDIKVVGGRARFVLVVAFGGRRGRLELNDYPVDSVFFVANRSFGKSGKGERSADDYDGECEQN